MTSFELLPWEAHDWHTLTREQQEARMADFRQRNLDAQTRIRYGQDPLPPALPDNVTLIRRKPKP